MDRFSQDMAELGAHLDFTSVDVVQQLPKEAP